MVKLLSSPGDILDGDAGMVIDRIYVMKRCRYCLEPATVIEDERLYCSKCYSRKEKNCEENRTGRLDNSSSENK